LRGQDRDNAAHLLCLGAYRFLNLPCRAHAANGPKFKWGRSGPGELPVVVVLALPVRTICDSLPCGANLPRRSGFAPTWGSYSRDAIGCFQRLTLAGPEINALPFAPGRDRHQMIWVPREAAMLSLRAVPDGFFPLSSSFRDPADSLCRTGGHDHAGACKRPQ